MQEQNSLPDATEATPVVVYGASGFALAIADMITTGSMLGRWRIAAYIDDFSHGQGRCIGDVPVIGFEDWRSRLADTPCAVAVGDPASRRRLTHRVAASGGRFATIVRGDGSISPNATVGEGTIVGFPAYIGPVTTLGRHVHVMPMAVIGHDVALGDYVTVCSSASIAGHVDVGPGCFVGAGAVITNGTPARPIRIGEGARIGAGAVVTKSVPPGVTVAGNPARPLRELARARRLTLGQ